MSGFNNPFPFPVPPAIASGPQDPTALPSAIAGIPGVPGPPPLGPVERIMQAASDPRIRAYMGGVAQSIGQGYRPGSSPFENIVRALGTGTQALTQEGHTQRQLGTREDIVGANIEQADRRLDQGEAALEQQDIHFNERIKDQREALGVNLADIKQQTAARAQRMAQEANLFPQQIVNEHLKTDRLVKELTQLDSQIVVGKATREDVLKNVRLSAELKESQAKLAAFEAKNAPVAAEAAVDAKERQLSVQERQVGAQERQAGAQETRAETEQMRARQGKPVNTAAIARIKRKAATELSKALEEREGKLDFTTRQEMKDTGQGLPVATDATRKLAEASLAFEAGRTALLPKPISFEELKVLRDSGGIQDGVRYVIYDMPDGVGGVSTKVVPPMENE